MTTLHCLLWLMQPILVETLKGIRWLRPTPVLFFLANAQADTQEHLHTAKRPGSVCPEGTIHMSEYVFPF
jgi:hypothetical protein